MNKDDILEEVGIMEGSVVSIYFIVHSYRFFIIMASKSCLVAFLHCRWLSDCSVLYFGRHDRLDLLFVRTYRFPHSFIFWRKYHVFFIIRRMIKHSYTHFKELEMKNKEEEMKKKKKKEEEPPSPSPSNSIHSIIVL